MAASDVGLADLVAVRHELISVRFELCLTASHQFQNWFLPTRAVINCVLLGPYPVKGNCIVLEDGPVGISGILIVLGSNVRRIGR